MRRVMTAACLVAALLAYTPSATADPIKLGHYSQQLGSGHAAVGVMITTHHRSRGVPAAPARAPVNSAGGSPSGGDGGEAPRALPTLASDSPLLTNSQPLGPGSFWYQNAGGQPCIYAASTSPLCYAVAQKTQPATDPAVIAATVADRLDLSAGRLEASPSVQTRGLAGASSWFWLSPAPQTRELSVALGGERVTVTAEPSVEWRFGDGAALNGGGGIAYQPGTPPAAAIVHRYETRCLPDDRGQNPYVLASCGDDGYLVEAVVGWRFSYRSSGPVTASGTLPSRTTTSSLVYPVSEARAFLVRGESQ
jgi:hypothetical protein